MGIDTHFYTIYGVKMPWNDEFHEAYEYGEVYDGRDTPWVLLDSMSGEYMIFGQLLFDSGNMRWGFEDGQQYAESSLDNLEGIAVYYCRNFAQKFPKFQDLIKPEDFKIMSLVHFS
jgi:hypothetical protein